ncbi:MAG: branched-chain amino acid ABC transporter permease [Rubrivivax sp.]
MDNLYVPLLNGLSYGLLLFLLGAGLTLIFSLMGVMNFAHAGFYMLGAYVGLAATPLLGFWAALAVAPLAAGALGGAFQRSVLARVHRLGPVHEMLATFGLLLLMTEAVQLVWGRAPLPAQVPDLLQGPAWPGGGFPAYRAFMMAAALAVLAALALAFVRTRLGLVLRAALSHPQTLQALGHDLRRIRRLVFAGGCALAGLAGAIGGNAFTTEPAMAAALGPLLFVIVVIGGLGSLAGAFVAALAVGLVQSFAVAFDLRVAGVAASQLAPLLPYALLVGLLALRPAGLMGTREH